MTSSEGARAAKISDGVEVWRVEVPLPHVGLCDDASTMAKAIPRGRALLLISYRGNGALASRT